MIRSLRERLTAWAQRRRLERLEDRARDIRDAYHQTVWGVAVLFDDPVKQVLFAHTVRPKATALAMEFNSLLPALRADDPLTEWTDLPVPSRCDRSGEFLNISGVQHP